MPIISVRDNENSRWKKNAKKRKNRKANKDRKEQGRPEAIVKRPVLNDFAEHLS